MCQSYNLLSHCEEDVTNYFIEKKQYITSHRLNECIKHHGHIKNMSERSGGLVVHHQQKG